MQLTTKGGHSFSLPYQLGSCSVVSIITWVTQLNVKCVSTWKYLRGL